MFKARWARRTDAARVKVFFEASMELEELPGEPGAFPRSWKESFRPGRAFRFCVVEDDERRVVGSCTIHDHFSTYRGRPIVGVEDVFVEESARGRGAGRTLLAFAERHAKSLSAARLELHVRDDNEARRLYERFGFETLPYYWMQKPLRPVKRAPRPA
ncbi:MAG: GNAT family N-acetyltransferase [Euryarchaeota archaeon]|nr:GNAT family N-acetyltransferase [Euryarchaeota archaeon]